MAATPAEVTEGVTSPRVTKKSFSQEFQDFLRNAPEKVSKQFIEEGLLGTGKGFMTKRDVANRVTVAQSAGLLSTQDEEHLMKNRLAGKTAGGKTRAPKTNGSGRAHREKEQEVNPKDALERVMPFMDAFEDLVNRAVVDPRISREELIRQALFTTAAFNGSISERLDS
jgi:hypothetical protein